MATIAAFATSFGASRTARTRNRALDLDELNRLLDLDALNRELQLASTPSHGTRTASAHNRSSP